LSAPRITVMNRPPVIAAGTTVKFSALLILEVAAVVFLLLSGTALPEHVASHFVADGSANSSMPRGAYLGLMVGLTVGLPFLLALPGWLMQRVPLSLVRLPHKEYWLAPERRASTLAFMTRRSTMFGAFVIVFLCYVHWLVVEANRAAPPYLATRPLVAGLLAFAICTMVWAGLFVAHFLRRP